MSGFGPDEMIIQSEPSSRFGLDAFRVTQAPKRALFSRTLVTSMADSEFVTLWPGGFTIKDSTDEQYHYAHMQEFSFNPDTVWMERVVQPKGDPVS